MRLDTIQITDFKSLRGPVELSLAPLTLLIGPNNAGKSSILQALALLTQSAASGMQQLRPQGELVDLGDSVAALTNFAKEGAAGWAVTLGWAVGHDQSPYLLSDLQVSLSVETVRIERLPDADRPMASELRSEKRLTFELAPRYPVDVLGVWDPPLRDNGTVKISLHGSGPEGSPFSAVTRIVQGQMSDPWMNATAVPVAGPDIRDRLASGDPEAAIVASLLVGDPFLRSRIKSALATYQYIGPARHPGRSWEELGPEPTGALTPAQVIDKIVYDRELRDRLSDRFSPQFHFRLEPDLRGNRQRALVAIDDAGNAVNLVNQGSGFAQLLWIPFMLETGKWNAERRQNEVPVVGLEEPELHLHPGLQPYVAGLIAGFAKSGMRIICTTQSEHLLTSVLSLVLDKSLAASDLAVYYVDGGEVSRLPVDEHGRLEGGLRGFFEANKEELRRQIELLTRNA